MLMHPYTKDLAHFYTQSANKRHHTRRRHWPEFDYIVTYINQLNKEELTIVELGCGDWRLYGYLIEHCPAKCFRYVWVDVSQWLIDLAIQQYPDATWLCDEMMSYIETIPQQSCDVIIGIASIQHIPTREQQSLIFHEIYRVLNYWWSLIMTNRCISKWFLRRYWIPLCKSFCYFLLTCGYLSWRDVMIPFTDWIVYHRFYHIYSHSRLDRLLKLAWFVVIQSCYISTQWAMTSKWQHSRNHFHIASKSISQQSH